MSNVREALNKAIAVHSYWKISYRKVLRGEIVLDPTEVRRWERCEFGRWLSESGRAHLGAQHGAVDIAHRHLHRVAAAVVTDVRSGQVDKAEGALAPNGEFARAEAVLTRQLNAARDGLR